MQGFFNALKAFFDTFPAAVFVPVIMFAINLAFKVKPAKAFTSALSAGVGLEGFSLVIGSYGSVINPVIDRMINASGINLPVYDLGWPNTSVVAYSTQAGMVFIAICIALQVILFLTHFTNVFQAGDLWNNYSYMCWGSMIFVLTGNMALAVATMIVQQIYTLLLTEVIAKRWSTYYGYPGCSIASLHTATICVAAIPINWLLNKLGLYKIEADPVAIKKKLGFIGEPMTLGLILGLIIGFVGNLTRIGELAAWGEILTCGIATSAVMSVFPRISAIFSGAFTAMTQASKQATKGFSGEWYLAVNDATGYGETATLISGLLCMPIALFLSFILPGNQCLPVVDLVAIPYCIQPMVAMANGNVVKSVIGGALVCVVFLYVCTLCGPTFDAVVKSVGGESAAGMMVTSYIIIGQPVGFVLFKLAELFGWVGIAIELAVFAVLYFVLKKNMDKIHAALEKQALNPAGKAE